MSEESTVVVRGQVVLPPDVPAGARADLIVQVEDVSRADAPSPVVAQQRQPDVALNARAALPFELTVPADRVEPRHSYSVRAHVDVSGTGSIERGDLISTQSYPVLTRGYGDEATVTVRPV
jgi:uncharacterized lipoprotein YbaY